MSRMRAMSFAAVVLFAASPVFADQGSVKGSAEVLSKIHQVNLDEIEAANLALQKTQDEGVRRYADHIIRDHAEADQKVSVTARQAKAELRQMPTEEHVGLMKRLNGLQGAEFDRAYMVAMSKGHQKVIDELQAARKSAKDEPVRDLISELIPTLDRHHEQAAQLVAALKVRKDVSS